MNMSSQNCATSDLSVALTRCNTDHCRISTESIFEFFLPSTIFLHGWKIVMNVGSSLQRNFGFWKEIWAVRGKSGHFCAWNYVKLRTNLTCLTGNKLFPALIFLLLHQSHYIIIEVKGDLWWSVVCLLTTMLQLWIFYMMLSRKLTIIMCQVEKKSKVC